MHNTITLGIMLKRHSTLTFIWVYIPETHVVVGRLDTAYAMMYVMNIVLGVCCRLLPLLYAGVLDTDIPRGVVRWCVFKPSVVRNVKYVCLNVSVTSQWFWIAGLLPFKAYPGYAIWWKQSFIYWPSMLKCDHSDYSLYNVFIKLLYFHLTTRWR